MSKLKERMAAFLNDRWLVFVAAMWLQSFAGIGYLFGSISPVIKSNLGYNQKQLARIGVAKDLGGSLGFSAGKLCEILPGWAAILIGAICNFVGYGWVWLVVTGRSPVLPLWAICILIFIGTNGDTYFNTVSLVSCVQNFPKSRGPVVGILKGFAGLSGAILTQVFALLHKPDKASLIFMGATGPAMVAVSLMFIIRPVSGQCRVRKYDPSNFLYVYSVCLVLAAYIMGVLIVQDLVDLSHNFSILFTTVLFLILLSPLAIPISTTFYLDVNYPMEEPLMSPKGVSSSAHKFPYESEYKPGLSEFKEEKSSYSGEDFTLTQALAKVDFWLIFCSFLLGGGSGVTIIDNLGQISQSFGYEDAKIFVSMICIWNFLGRVAGGYFSEIIVRDHAYPRPIGIAVAQLILAIGHFLFAMDWPGTMYIGTLLVGIGYGAHWAIVPATASELFGIKNFGAIYNFLNIANPAGSLILSGLITSTLYDYEAQKQAQGHHHNGKRFSKLGFKNDGGLFGKGELKCEGSSCFFASSLIMMSVCLVACGLSLYLVYRTKRVYSSLYGTGPR